MVENFLARFDRLLDAAELDRTDRDDVRLRVLTDYIVLPETAAAQDRDKIDAALCVLLRKASMAGVARVAPRLAGRNDLSAAAITALLDRGGVAAAAALRLANGLDAATLARFALGADVSLAAAVASRRSLDPALAAALFRRLERDVLLALVENLSVTLDRATAAWLVSRGRHDDALARALLARGPLAVDMAPLFLSASREERAAMIVAARRRDLGEPPEFRVPAPENLSAALEHACSMDDRGALIDALAQRLGLARKDTERLLDDTGGEVFALMLNVAGVSALQAARLMGWRLSLAVDDRRLVTLARLQGELATQTARSVLSAIAGRALVPAARLHDRRAAERSDPLRRALAATAQGEAPRSHSHALARG